MLTATKLMCFCDCSQVHMPGRVTKWLSIVVGTQLEAKNVDNNNKYSKRAKMQNGQLNGTISWKKMLQQRFILKRP